MRRFLLHPLYWAAFVAAGCSLRSLDELKRCNGKGESDECPRVGAGAQGVGGAAGSDGGSVAGASSGVGGQAAAPSGEGGAAGAEPEPELVLLYAYREPDELDMETLQESKAIRPIFVIKNQSEEQVDVSTLSIRYYYTLENPMPQEFKCDFVDQPPVGVVTDCDAVAVTFGMLNSDQAKDYAEVTFVPPDGETWLIPQLGGESGRIQLRFLKTGFGLQDQTKDYSFHEPNIDDPVLWDHVTLYRDGALVWGIEPK